MDLQGVGAVAAAAVAALAVPAALVTGRWSTRGALAQAEATYKAALEASQSSDKQWRRSVQRDSYSAFLLTSTQLHTKAERLMTLRPINSDTLTTTFDEIGRLRDDLEAKLVVVELEGPDSVVEAARNLTSAVKRFTSSRQEYMSIVHAEHKLRTLIRDNTSSPSALPALQSALDSLRGTIHTCRWEGPAPFLIGSLGNPLPDEVATAYEQAVLAFSRLPGGTFTGYEEQYLLQGTFKFQSNPAEETREYTRSKHAFIHATRTALG
ncbi:hypothetical protein [Streptomyces carpinensis]|uniref:Secreted protein n=1 Tax=Streptomyces carpinensis TaxID=66369 RepID=A0ABV1VW70_9ACTN|nr:hypothetical protein [Streptomyces carpinensis]